MHIISETNRTTADHVTKRLMMGPRLIALYLMALAILYPFTPLAAKQNEIHGNVLVIYSANNRMPWQKRLRSGLITGLETANTGPTLFEEYLDVTRFSDLAHAERFTEYLKDKYRDRPIDVLVIQGRPASRLIMANKDLFPQAWLLMLAPHIDPEQILRGGSKVSVIKRDDDIITSFDSMVAVMKSKHVVVLGDTHTPFVRHYEKQLKTERPSGWNGITVEYLLDLPLEEMRRRVSNLPQGSVAFYLLIFQDGAGETYTPYEVARQLAEKSSVPIFCHWDTLLGSGIVGGYMLSAERTGLAAAEEILNILQVGSTTLDRKSPGRLFADFYDWRSLTRYGLDPARLPKGSQILYYQPTLWAQYRIHIITAGALIIILSALSILLAYALAGRRRAVKDIELERLHLEERVVERTEDLSRSNELLERMNTEISEKNVKLEKALAEINTLRGFLPICSNCKKIRDDRGYWNQIEKYIQERSEAIFSHSICPDCLKKLYPDMADKVLSKTENLS